MRFQQISAISAAPLFVEGGYYLTIHPKMKIFSLVSYIFINLVRNQFLQFFFFALFLNFDFKDHFGPLIMFLPNFGN